MTSGVSAGQFLTPLIVKYLLDEYAFTGACLIYGALILNTLVSGMLFHPVKWHSKTTVEEIAEKERGNGIDNEDELMEIPKNKIENDQIKKLCARERYNSIASEISLGVSTLQIPDISVHESTENIKIDNCILRFFYFLYLIIKQVVLSIINYLRILRYKRAIITSFGMAFFVTGYINFLMMVPFTLQSKGFSLEQSAWCLSVGGIFNFILRLTISVLSDHPKFRKRICYMSGALIVSISTASKFLYLRTTFDILSI